MIVAERKPIEEILEMVKDFKKVLIVGCKGCVTVCNAGGRKEVGILASIIRLARKKDGNPIEITEHTLERQCDPEYIDLLDGMVQQHEAVVSMACSVGPQFIAQRYPECLVYPGLNTSFMGGATEHGVWAEFCQACGDWPDSPFRRPPVPLPVVPRACSTVLAADPPAENAKSARTWTACGT